MGFSLVQIFIVITLVYKVEQIGEFFNMFTVRWYHGVTAVVASLMAGFSVWFSARVIYRVALPGFLTVAGPNPAPWLRTWLPRIIGTMLPFLVGIQVAAKALDLGMNLTMFVFAIALVFGSVVLFVLFAIRRDVRFMASLFDATDKPGQLKSPAEDPIYSCWADLPPRTHLLMRISYYGLAVIALVSIIWPKLIAMMLGTVAFVILAGAFIVPLGTRLVHASILRDWPVFWIVGLLLVTTLSIKFDDNHEMRGPIQNTYKTPTYTLEDWIKDRARQACANNYGQKKCPIFLVATEGGGIRAAYWTALVLNALNDATDGEFQKHVLAISSVSGGSLGAATFLELNADSNGSIRSDEPKISSSTELGHEFLKRDYLGVVVPRLFFSDIPKWILPFSFLPSRGTALEEAWEDGWNKAIGNDRFASSYGNIGLTNSDNTVNRPLLLLNSAVVQTGQRLIHAPEPFKGFNDIFAGALDGYHQLGGRLRISTAVHNSARFPYISPAGAYTDPMLRQAQLVDGGYFENSGAATINDLASHIQDLKNNYDLRVIIISNDPRKYLPCTQFCTIDKAYQRHGDVAAPVVTLLNTRTARGQTALERLKSEFNHCEANEKIHWLGIVKNKGAPELPLGWALSEPAMNEMLQQALCPSPNDGRIHEAYYEMEEIFALIMGEQAAMSHPAIKLIKNGCPNQ